MDPTTQELLSLAIERTQRLPVLTIITFRPEFTPPWPDQPHVSSLMLPRLGRGDGALMVEQVVGAKALPAEVSAHILDKTDGVPLFVEELTKAVLESGLIREADNRYVLAGPLPPLAIPAAHAPLLRPGRFDRALRPPRSGGPARSGVRIPGVRCRSCRALQGTRGRVPRRWRPGLLRLPTSARGRCRAGGAQRASDCRGRRCARAAYRRAAPGPRRHCYRHGGGGRPDRKAPPAKWPWSAMCRILPRGCRCWRRRTR